MLYALGAKIRLLYKIFWMNRKMEVHEISDTVDVWELFLKWVLCLFTGERKQQHIDD